jgi:hypothetical protein
MAAVVMVASDMVAAVMAAVMMVGNLWFKSWLP